MIWVGAEQENFLLWDSTAAITPNLARRAVDFFHDVIRRREGKRKLDLSGKLRLTATAAGPLRPAPGTRIMDQVEYQMIACPRELVTAAPRRPQSGPTQDQHRGASRV